MKNFHAFIATVNANLTEAHDHSHWTKANWTKANEYSHWTDHTKVIRTSSWRHKEWGSVSSGGAVPWRTPAEKSEYEEVDYFVFYDTIHGTTFGGRYDTEQKAQAALDKAKRDHQKEVAKYVTAPQVRKRIQELENEIVGIGNQPSMAGGAVRMKRAEDEIKRLKQQLRSLGVRESFKHHISEAVHGIAESIAYPRADYSVDDYELFSTAENAHAAARALNKLINDSVRKHIHPPDKVSLERLKWLGDTWEAKRYEDGVTERIRMMSRDIRKGMEDTRAAAFFSKAGAFDGEPQRLIVRHLQKVGAWMLGIPKWHGWN